MIENSNPTKFGLILAFCLFGGFQLPASASFVSPVLATTMPTACLQQESAKQKPKTKNSGEKPKQSDAKPPPSYTAEQVIGFMDKNRDGKISKDEASAELKPNFGYVDTNHDGQIDLKEAKAMLAFTRQQNATPAILPSKKSDKPNVVVTVKQLMDAMDRNGDGKISKAEASEDLKLYFGDFDVDQDRMIDRKEAQQVARVANQVSGVEPSKAKAPSKSKVTAKQLIQNADKDGDGKISMDEASEQLKPNFKYIDTDNDGLIDESEAQVMADYVNKQRK